jgi:16S rRNA (adenine1518-N6/adenine1519-N6)-dimethyltransferase
MGQNFLINQHALEHIVDTAALSPHDLVVEVGPGLGVLTWELVHRAGHVIAVELDKRLAERLRTEFARPAKPTQAPLTIIQSDILDLPPADILHRATMLHEYNDTAPLHAAPPYRVVANLPYAITSPVLRHFLEHTPQPERMVVLVQWEVAQRITAGPGKLSVLAHAIQMYAEPEIAGRIKASSFIPQPAVDTAILCLHVRPTPAVDVADSKAFFRLIKAGFLHARKKLSNALPGGLAAMHEPVERNTVLHALEQAHIAADRRAETLTLDEWATLYHALQSIEG